jgi:hypothetical protein
MALLLPLFAQAQDSPYETYEWESYPVEWKFEGRMSEKGFMPDLDPAAVESITYREDGRNPGNPQGFITFSTTRRAYLSLLFYSPAGRSSIMVASLPVYEHQQVTASFNLPPNESEGVTRLLLWSEPTAREWLPLLARHPEFTSEPVTGLIADYWFSRESTGASRYPWEDFYRPAEYPPPGYYYFDVPAAVARLSAADRPVLKDCALVNHGLTQQATDEYGFYGRWVLSWGNGIDILLEVPPYLDFRRAHLAVYGSSTVGFGVPHSPALELEVNGWAVPTGGFAIEYDDVTQPVVLDVSQYLENGQNSIAISLGPSADGAWLVSRIELWME